MVLQLVLAVVVLVAGVALATYYLKTSPKAKPRERKPAAPLVQVVPLRYQSHTMRIEAMGTVLAAREVSLTPGVSGEIISIGSNLQPGGFFKRGETLATIDPIDFQLTVLQFQQDVARAESELDLEMGNQQIARKEFEILGQQVSESEKKLMLREPQLAIKKVALDTARAKLAQAELNLSRTEVSAPFNGVVLKRTIHSGTRVTPSTPLATLAGSEEFWIKLAVPVEQLQWIKIPQNPSDEGSTVRILLPYGEGKEAVRQGRVSRLAADLDTQGRMAVLYVTVSDPLCLQPANHGKRQLLLNSFVQVEISGRELDSVIAIDREHLREDNHIWLLGKDDKLEIHPVTIIARTRNLVLIHADIMDDERLITSSLAAPVAGTPLKVMSAGGGSRPKEIAASPHIEIHRMETAQ